MEVTVSNKIELSGTPKILKDMLLDDLTFPNPVYVEAISQGYNVYGVDKEIYNFEILPAGNLVVPRGYQKKLLRLIDNLDVKATIHQALTYFSPLNIDSSMISYRNYQREAVHNLMVNGQEGVLVAPAGSGKTVIGISLVPLTGQPCLWLTHTKPLKDQAIDRIAEFLPSLTEEDVGSIGDGEWRIGNIITVAMVQTLLRRLRAGGLEDLGKLFGLVILDEAHHCPATTFREVVGAFNPYYLYALTATPYRRDKLEALMFQTIGERLAEITQAQVESEGGIMRPVVKYREIKSRPVKINGENILETNKIQTILKEYVVINKQRNQTIVSDVVREAVDGNICIVLSDRKIHCELLYEMIGLAWDKVGIATGNCTKKQVRETIKSLESGKITVLVATSSLLGEGFDYKPLNRVFIAMPFRAEAKVEQIIGRVQRPADGKVDAIVYEYIDTNCGVLRSQFYSKHSNCRCNVYKRLGVTVEPY